MQRIFYILRKAFVPSLTIFLLLVSSIPVAAQDTVNNNDVFVLSSLEQKFWETIPIDAEYTEEGFLKAEELRLEGIKKAEEGINRFISQTTPKLTRDTVNLGTDRTFYNAGWGVYWADYTGSLTGNWQSQSYLENNQDEAIAIVGGGANAGTATAISYVGNQFTVSGIGSQSANIYMYGNYAGYILSYVSPSGSAGVDIYLVVKNDTTQVEYSTNILNSSVGGGTQQWSTSFNTGIGITLQANHSYSVYLKLVSSISAWGIGMSASDWGRFDGDTGQYANFSSIVIDF